MKVLFSIVGFVVVMLLLAAAGVITGNMCVENVACVKATQGSITFYSPHNRRP